MLLKRLLWAVGFVLSGGAARAQVPSDSAIRAVLVRRAEGWKGPGIVVGISDSGLRRIIVYGNRSAGGPPLDQRTVFEIGSVTKVFTGILLADMAARGEVQLDDPIARYLPPGVTAPAENGRPITLVDLATHGSGLPRLPANLEPRDPENPYADYDAERMYRFLSSYRPARAPEAQYEYSNFGAGLLGALLARRLGLSYEDALTRRVFQPLGLRETAIRLGPELAGRFATGHSAGLAPAKAWDLDAMAGAGGLRSTLTDMLRFLEANLSPGNTPIGRALTRAAEARRGAGPGMRIGLGWHVLERPGHTIVWHNGGTGGFHSFAAFDRGTRRAVVLLANASQNIDDIGFHLMDSSLPLAGAKPTVARREISLDPAVLDRLVGEYQLAPTFSIVISRENDALFAQATGQPRFPIFPEAADRFFFKVVDAQLVFAMNGMGQVSGLTLHQGGQEIPGKKIR